MNTLVIDIGGSNVKLWYTESLKEKIPSGRNFTPREFVRGVKQHIDDKAFERISIGYPGDVLYGRVHQEPYNLGKGWVDFDFSEAFGIPARVMNDACMQALGSYEGGRMLYLGLGTSLGTVYVIEGQIVPLALGHLQFRRNSSFEDRLSRRGLQTAGKARWRRAVGEAARVLHAAFLVDYVVLGGGNAKLLEKIPRGCRRGGNHNAYLGGLKMWESDVFAPAVESQAAIPQIA